MLCGESFGETAQRTQEPSEDRAWTERRCTTSVILTLSCTTGRHRLPLHAMVQLVLASPHESSVVINPSTWRNQMQMPLECSSSGACAGEQMSEQRPCGIKV